jgi:hypothetical protein
MFVVFTRQRLCRTLLDKGSAGPAKGFQNHSKDFLNFVKIWSVLINTFRYIYVHLSIYL